MKITVQVNFNAAKVLKERGLGGDHRAQVAFASKIKDKLDPYTPMDRGELKKPIIAPDGSSLTYTQPYAHYQYAGQVLAGRAPKKPNGKELTYSGGGLRGPQWDKRMLADKHDELVRDLEKIIGGG